MPVANLADQYRVGTQVVEKVYAGDKLVWPMTPDWPTGLIIHHAGSTAPKGWAICDGSAHGSSDLQALIGSPNTPNLVDMFVRTTSGGANTTALVAGNLPQHAHTMGNDSASHTHTGTSGYMSANNTHSHTATLGDNDTRHYHGIPASTTSTVSAWHEHSSLIFNEGDGGDGDGSWVDQSPSSDGYTKDVGDTANPSANHTHVLPASNTDYISQGHTHAVTSTAASPEPTHNHTFDVSGTGTHTHVVNGEGGGAAFSVVPEHYALIYIIRL